MLILLNVWWRLLTIHCARLAAIGGLIWSIYKLWVDSSVIAPISPILVILFKEYSIYYYLLSFFLLMTIPCNGVARYILCDISGFLSIDGWGPQRLMWVARCRIGCLNQALCHSTRRRYSPRPLTRLRKLWPDTTGSLILVARKKELEIHLFGQDGCSDWRMRLAFRCACIRW